jgi:hypothetical protein
VVPDWSGLVALLIILACSAGILVWRYRYVMAKREQVGLLLEEMSQAQRAAQEKFRALKGRAAVYSQDEAEPYGSMACMFT